MDKDLKREIILDNYQNPFHRGIKDNYQKININSESCIDNVDIYFDIDNNIIKDIYFEGEACTISTSATSIMIKILIGKSINEATNILYNYKNMIMEKEYDRTLLKELNVYDEISKQPNRINCALLPLKAIEKIISNLEN